MYEVRKKAAVDFATYASLSLSWIALGILPASQRLPRGRPLLLPVLLSRLAVSPPGSPPSPLFDDVAGGEQGIHADPDASDDVGARALLGLHQHSRPSRHSEG